MATWTTRVDERPEGAELSIGDELHTVGEEIAGYVLLAEVPRLRAPSTVSVRRASDQTSLTEVTAAPAAGQFRVVYGPRVRYAGAVEFAPADAGLQVLVSYEGTGSAVWARDVNRLQTEKIDRDGSMPFTGNVGIGRDPYWGLHQLGGGHRLEGIFMPEPFSTPMGMPGTASYTYYVVAQDRNGRFGLISDPHVATSSNATLSATNYNRIEWSPVPGAVSYFVMKGNTSTLLGTTTDTRMDDKGQATTPFTPPTHNESADMLVDGWLGLGTTTPSSRLHVAGNAHVSGYGSFGTAPGATTALAVQPTSAAHVGLLVKGLAGQTGSLAQWQKSDGTVLSQIRYDGAWLHNNPLVMTTNGQGLSLVGTDSAYVGLSPRGSGAGRKAWIGFGVANTTTLTVANEDAGPLVLTTQSGQLVEVTQHLLVRGTGSSFVSGKLAIGAASTPAYGMHLFGGGIYAQKLTMGAVTAATQGTAGTTTYHYRVVPLDRAGRKAMYSAASIATGNATLSATNFVRLSWGAVTGAASYDVLRSTDGTSYSLIGNTTGTLLDDTGQAATAYTQPTRNTTADVTADGAIVSYATGTGYGEAAFTAMGAQGSDTSIVLGQPNVVHWRVKNEATTGKLVLSTGATGLERFVINTAGNVGIGTTNPTERLHVAGAVRLDSRSTAASGDLDRLVFGKDHLSIPGNYYDIAEIRANTGNGYTGRLDFYTSKFVGSGSYASTFAMRIDESQNVGIGTSAPATRLHVQGSSPAVRIDDAAGYYPTLEFYAKGAGASPTSVGTIFGYSGMGLYFDVAGAASRHLFRTAGADRAVITEAGMGVGTTAPVNRLQVHGGADTALVVGDRATSGSVGLQFLGTGYKHAGIAFNGDALVVENASSSHKPSTWYASSLMNFIVRNGSVGINTPTPTARLDVIGGIRAHTTSGAGLLLEKGGDANRNFLRWKQGTANWQAGFRGAPYYWALEWQSNDGTTPADDTGWLNVLTATTAGYLGMGTTNPLYRFHVVGTEYSALACFQSNNTLGTWLTLKNTDTGGREVQIISTGSGNGGGAGNMLLNGALSVAPGADNATGLGTSGLRWSAVYAVNGAIQTSNRAEKDLHGEVDPAVALHAVRGIPVHRYTYKRGTPLRHIGIVIDELPRWMWTDPEGNGFNYNTLTGVNTAAIRALSEQVDDEVGRLKHRVAELEREVAALRAA